VHVSVVCQVPFASQVCASSPAHCFIPGVHWPEQIPLLHPLFAQSLSCAQCRPYAHGEHEPPQSMSVSSPFLIESLHCAGTQTWLELHAKVSQSVPRKHPPPTGHPGQLLPPQSLPVSSPFFTPSLQLGPTGASHLPPVHLPLSQSLPALHAWSAAHLLGQSPPQSTSVSLPSFFPFEQLGHRGSWGQS
jgi:hypothetical protein